jgi:hypothetical protein
MPVNARELLVLNKATGIDPLVDAILTEGSAEQALYKRAAEIQRSSVKKSYVEACLLASQNVEKIADILELDPNLISMYGAVFYDTENLDKLSKIELLDVKDRQEHLLKLWALHQGLDFLAWRLGGPVLVNPIEGLQELFSTAMYKAKEACFSGNASEESKQAAGWTKLSMDLARLLKAYTQDSNQAKRDLEIALEDVIPDFKGFGDIMTLENPSSE